MKSEAQIDVSMVGQIPAVPTILDVVQKTTGMGFAAIARVTATQWIACAVFDTIGFGLKAGGELDIQTTICHEIRQSRQEVIINNVDEDERYCAHPTPRMYGFQSYISVPIILKNGALFGTLCAIDPKPRDLNNAATVSMFRLFADLISFYIDTHQQLNFAENVLTTERTNAQLREQFIAVLGHDLRNPLGAVHGGLHLLNHAKLDDRSKQLVKMMQGSVNRMGELISNVLDLARGRLGGGLKLDLQETTALETTLSQVINELRAGHPEKSIYTSIELNVPICCDAARVGQLLSNILANALTYGAADKPINVIARVERSTFELAVINGGEPISAEALKRLFEPYERGGGKESAQGLGLGLYIASEIAKAHKGKLSARSDVNETRFTLTMPAAKDADVIP